MDRLDACPDSPGVEEEKGCPSKYKMVVVKKDRIEIKKQIIFGVRLGEDHRQGELRHPRRRGAGAEGRAVIKKIRIEGHTDSVGTDAANLRLSQKRADAVMAQLIKRGIDPGRMEAVGFGETKPIAPNATKAGRAENRRTEFNIVEQ